MKAPKDDDKKKQLFEEFMLKNQMRIDNFIKDHSRGTPLPVVWDKKTQNWIWLNRAKRRKLQQ